LRPNGAGVPSAIDVWIAERFLKPPPLSLAAALAAAVGVEADLTLEPHAAAVSDRHPTAMSQTVGVLSRRRTSRFAMRARCSMMMLILP
jgi:hypothetical protein